RTSADRENIKNFVCTGNENSIYAPWSLHFVVMKRANDIIANVPGISMDQDTKNFILGQAYFVHAVMHLEIADLYGTDKQGAPVQNRTNPIAFPAQLPSVKDNYAYIVADLKKAASLLPYFDKLAKTDYGRAHKTAAWAYLAKTYLHAKDYANAEKYADSVILSGKHALLPNYADVFKIANNYSSEYIWSVASSLNGQSILPGAMLENKGWGLYNGFGYFQPTKELVDEFESGDKRLPVTILKSGDTFQYFGQTYTYPIGGKSNSLTGYQFNKYMEPFSYAGGIHVSPNGDEPSTDLNVPLLRYAEILLIKAEAQIMQGKNGDAALNLVRQRAGLSPVSGATMANLKHERRVELAGEWSDRNFDLVRWGDAQATYAKPLHGANGSVVWKARNFDPARDNVWPIPPKDIQISQGQLKQNAGW
ncbi:MAG TPA: RagB/SusD family nutrient uptake outer membrane protein, partial [Mucilaginibacter sp.]